MRFLAPRATTRSSESLSFLEHPPASQANDGEHLEFPPLSRDRSGDVGEMIKDLSLPDAESLGKISGRHFLFMQKGDHPLPDGQGSRLFTHDQPFFRNPLQIPSGPFRSPLLPGVCRIPRDDLRFPVLRGTPHPQVRSRVF
jgi:hypothetical protein